MGNSPNLTYNVGLYFGQYTYHVEENDPPTAFDLQYKITYPSLKIDFNRDRALHRQSFGFHTTLYSFRPGELTPTSSESNKRRTIMPTERSIETAYLYFSDAFTWRERLHIDAGIRLSVYNRFGPGDLSIRHFDATGAAVCNRLGTLRIGRDHQHTSVPNAVVAAVRPISNHR